MMKLSFVRCHQPVTFAETGNGPRTTFGATAIDADCKGVLITADVNFVHLKFPGSDLKHIVPWANIKQAIISEEDGTEGIVVGGGQEGAKAEGLQSNLGQNSKLHKAKRGSGR